MGRTYSKIPMMASWCLLLAGMPFTAIAIDLRAGDLTVLPAGTSLVQFAYINAEQYGLYRGGDRISSTPNINVNISRVRLMHYFTVASQPASMYVEQPWGTVSSNGLPSGRAEASGPLDTSLFLSFWPYSNTETQTYALVAAYYFAPTGSYDSNSSVNVGENRRSAALQVGYQTRIADGIDWLLAADIVHYGSNDEFGIAKQQLTRTPLSTIQTGILYLISPNLSFGASLFHTFGGQTTVGDISRNDRVEVNRFMLAGNLKLQDLKSVLTFQYGRDIDTENGPLESRRFLFRLTRTF